MKKLNSILMMLLVAMTSVVFTSCEKEQDELIIGTWNVTTLDYKVYQNGELADTGSEPFRETWSFTKEGKLIVKYTGDKGGVEQDTYTYSVAGNKLQTNLVRDYFSETKNYLIIETLDSNHMVLSIEEDYHDTDEYGNYYSYTYKYTVNLRK